MASNEQKAAAFDRRLRVYVGTRVPAVARWVHLTVAKRLLEGTARRTPRDTRTLVNDWHNDVGTAVPREPLPTEARGEPDTGSLLSPLRALRPYGLSTLSNPQIRAWVAELGLWPGGGPKTTPEGFSTQAPSGMLGITTLEVVAELQGARIAVPQNLGDPF